MNKHSTKTDSEAVRLILSRAIAYAEAVGAYLDEIGMDQDRKSGWAVTEGDMKTMLQLLTEQAAEEIR